MHDSAKYLIHADITASGVVERNDVVGAIFGQTEGLLGDDLNLRELQDHSKVGRIDVDVDSEGGQSFGEITIASGLNRVETALLAASLETIDRVGPCRSTIEVSDVEDVRSAKRRAIVERATDLLADLEDESVTSVDIVEEVRQRVRVEDVTDYEGYPAGPRVADSDAAVVVEGRADVLQLLQYGIKNAVAVEGTDVPQTIADLTNRRTATAFLDGDRGGELILQELVQVGSIDYVAFAPPGAAVEDLSRNQIVTALREKRPYEAVAGTVEPDPVDGSDSSAGESAGESRTTVDDPVTTSGGSAAAVEATPAVESATPEATPVNDPLAAGTADDEAGERTADATETATERPDTVAGHSRAVIDEGTDLVRLIDDDARVLREGPADDAFDLVERADTVPATVVLDGPVTQRLLDVAAQRGVGQLIGSREGEFVKRPTSVRVRTIDEF